jgi:hypothetical protein
MTESQIEAHFVTRAKEHFAVVRKLKWINHVGAPDRILINRGRVVFVELKSSTTGPRFPSGHHEAQQDREHQRMRAAGADVRVLWSFEQIDQLFGEFR